MSDPVRRPGGGEPVRATEDAERPGSAVARAWDDLRHSRGRDVANSRPLPEWVRGFVWILDDAFAVPGAPGRRVGVDGMIAFVPVVGDAAGIVLGGIVVVAGIGAGVSVPTVLRMGLNMGLEAVVGLIPFVGPVFDLAYKANSRNLALIEADLADRAATRRSSMVVLATSMFGAVLLIALFVLTVVGAVAVLVWLLARWF